MAVVVMALAGCGGSSTTGPDASARDVATNDALRLVGDSNVPELDSSSADSGVVEFDSTVAMDATAPMDDAGLPAEDVAPTGDDATSAVDATPPPTDTPIVMPDAAGCPDGQGMCPRTPFNNEQMSSYTCQPLVAGVCPAPDLIVVGDLLVDDGDGHRIGMTVQNFAAGDAEVAEGCVQGAGSRRLLRFNFAAANVGTQNMNVGRPDERDATHWEFFAAHGHFHVKGWGDYRLRTIGDNAEVGYGHKQSFCLEDNIRTSDRSGPRQFAPPLCEHFDPNEPFESRPEFGLSVGWGDEYPANVRCQWIDLGTSDPAGTGFVRDGFYNLDVSVNMSRDGSHLYRENNYGNNTVRTRVQITGNTVQACAEHAGETCSGGHYRCDGSCG